MSQILLIEPDRVLAETYRQALLGAGHQVVCCASAQAGIISADQHCPDLIILELQLIEHSGIEFLYELRSYQDWQLIPVIIQSHVPPGEFTANHRLLSEQLGVTTYLYKPNASLRDLLAVVQERLQLPIPA
ncbi:MAG TPA: response regulator [Candidatus Saccharimonadales bacterium]|nr:response regulator [Candidatus Saccharimonadales bacterium]